MHNGTTTYYYRFNLQGDVTGIYNSAGHLITEYTYDAWGKLLDTTGNTLIGLINPILYRGYYYDMETGLYYLNSRYYDPETCRFINADGLLSTGQGVLGYNMFAYCGNNPVNRADPTGQSWIDAVPSFVEAIVAPVEALVLFIQLKMMGFQNITFASAMDCRNTLKTFEIDTVEEKAHFFSQCYVESKLSLLEAGWLSDEDAEFYRKQQWYYPYYGAGYIQISTEANYKALAEYMGDPLIWELGPEYVAENYPWSASGWFWSDKNINDVIEKGGNVRAVTGIVNGGYSKLAEREAAYNKFLPLLGG